MGAKTISFPKGRGHLTHNNREFISKNVAPERISWNRIYKQESLGDAYEICFGQALREYNENQKRKDRRKENYLKEIENSGNGEKTFYENVVQIGKMTDTPVVDSEGNLTEDAKVAIEVLEQYAKTFQERNPNLYMFNCVMHLDEATPHLHIDYIPVAHGYKNGLRTRNSLTKAYQEMGFEKAVSKKNNETVAWQNRERSYIKELCNEHGIEIKEKGEKRENYSLAEYKEAIHKAVTLEKENIKIEDCLEKKKELLAKYELSEKTRKDVAKEVEAEKKGVKSEAEPIKNLLGHETEYVKVKKSIWKDMQKAYEYGVSQEKIVEQYEKKIIEQNKNIKRLTVLVDKCKEFLEQRRLLEIFMLFLNPPKVSVKKKLEEMKLEMKEKRLNENQIQKRRNTLEER